MLAAIPSVDRVLNMAATQALIFEYGRMPVLTAIRAMLTELRDNVAQAHILPADIFAEPAINLAPAITAPASQSPSAAASL